MSQKIGLAMREGGDNAPINFNFKVKQPVFAHIQNYLHSTNKRTKAVENGLNKRRRAEGKLMQLSEDELTAYSRVSSLGVPLVDTGIEIFYNEENPKKGNALKFNGFSKKMEEMGYVLTSVYVNINPKATTDANAKHSLRFVYNKAEEQLDAPQPILDLFEDLCECTWDMVHIWNNPDGTITINAGGKGQAKAPVMDIFRLYEKTEQTGGDTLPAGIYMRWNELVKELVS